jgi:SNF2 family DNA or RNA helicase
LRNDAVDFKDVRFDYLILDEAQAIKSADSVSAKAARLLRANHRLAMSGTPIENHLGELWSLFEFLNPGMLGAARTNAPGARLDGGSRPEGRGAGTGPRNPDDETRKLLAHALRPFLLRRTKEQVVQDLPPKVEQTLYCELERDQRRRYDEMRDRYRETLLGRIGNGGIERSKLQILEALLRLRQAAIHPGLIDKRRTGESSAKLDMLLPQLREVLDEGHKILVFRSSRACWRSCAGISIVIASHTNTSTARLETVKPASSAFKPSPIADCF